MVDVPAPAAPGLVQALAQRGHSVSGTGLARSRGVRPLRSLRLPTGTTLLVHGPEVAREHPARLAALRRGVEQTTPGAWLRRTLGGRLGVAIVGGRPAGLAAAMLGWVLSATGRDPSVFLGADCPQLGGWSRLGEGRWSVAEWADGSGDLGEARPELTVCLDDGGDDPDWALGACLADGDGHDDATTFGLGDGVDWRGTDLRESPGSLRLRVFRHGGFAGELQLGLNGRHRALAALAALCVAERLGVPAAEAREALGEFRGVRRDFEVRGSFGGVTVVDDAAGDAAAARRAVDLAREVYGRRRLWVAAAVDRLGPTGSGALTAVLAGADAVVAVGGDEPAAGGLVRALARAGVPACRSADPAAAVANPGRRPEPGDVLLTLGAGDVGTLADACIRRLSRDRPAG